MKTLLFIFILLVCAIPAQATIYFARSDGSNATNCTGLTDAAYDGSGTGEACAYTLAVALVQATCNDTIKVKNGQTFSGNFSLTDKSCSVSTPITVTSVAAASLPTGRVSPSDVANMPKINTPNSFGVFTSATNAGWWVLDGLEITDDAGQVAVPNLIDYGSNQNAHDMTLKRLYIHQKETGTDTTESGIGYHRSVIRAVQFEGTNILYKWCYVGPFMGYYYTSVGIGTHTQMESSVFLSVGGNGISLVDNYFNAWWNTIFLGGADTAPNNTANLTSATTTSATFDNVTGLTAGVVIRFELHGTGTVNRTGITSACPGTGGVWPGQGSDSTATLTRTSGVALTSSDFHTIGNMINGGDASEGLWGMCSAAGDVYTFADVKSAHANNGTVSWVLYQAAIVTSVVGSTVNYTPYGSTPLASNGATTASWNYGDQGLVSDVLFQRNTFDKDVDFAVDVLARSGASPKGIYEIKNANRLTVEGNYFYGYPSLMAQYPSNQYGTAPWITVRDVIIRNNWMELATGHLTSSREAISITSQNDYATITPFTNVQIYNNLIFGGESSFVTGKAVLGVYEIYHNTALSGEGGTFAFHGTVNVFEVFPTYLFRDNIVLMSIAGLNCGVGSNPTACFPSGSTFATNVAVNNAGVSGGDLGLNNYTYMGSRIAPVVTTVADVGFTNVASKVYSLAVSSPYKGTGSAGSDPGVDWGVLLTALGVTNGGGTNVSGKVTFSGKVTAH